MILDSITMNDDYEGDFTTRRALIYTLRFTAKTYLYGPVASAGTDIIRKVSVGYVAGARDGRNVERDVTYSVEPRAIKNYDGVVVTTLSEDISESVTSINVAEVASITKGGNIIINGESLYVSKITGNKLTVRRGQDGTTPVSHVAGSEIGTITAADNILIPTGDDFGFDGGFLMKMTKKFDDLNETFNVSNDIITPEVEPAPVKKIEEKKSSTDITKDYEYTRGNLYSLIEKGQEAINGILELAQETEQARAYEVAGQLIKSVADATDKLMELQKRLKEVEEEKQTKGPSTVNNALFVGSHC